ncbi:P-loop containing nucleoside triphosphate hydrolase protein [Myriangium duriaei CBS 260.36]|uniref:P-loop containing nucleoside triphosphate hydrolase protein n=1 Tax=Myriangium duriaei CBS 260.36 TaxID=1168546 RepID=A0A9P4JCF5_9PEZI|nr:P-loop containing nucleoside triphosphate hydrolase protein [Myriangium duriaei CBS 260.36]
MKRRGVSDQVRGIWACTTAADRASLLFSCLAAIAAGALNPLLTVIYGQLAGAFEAFTQGTQTPSWLTNKVAHYALFFVYLAIAEFVLIFLATFGFFYSGERVTQRLRATYLKAVLRQDQEFFDTASVGDITARLTSDIDHLQEAITNKLPLMLISSATFATAFIVVFIESWRLGLIQLSTIATVLITGITGSRISSRYAKQKADFDRAASSVAQEALGSMQHVLSYGLQATWAQRYDANLVKAEHSGLRNRLCVVLTLAVMNNVSYLSFALSFWQGSRYMVEGSVNSAGVVTMTMAIVIGAFSISNVTPNLQAFISALSAMSGSSEMISRVSSQDAFSTEGLRPEVVKGDFAFEAVSFTYPSRPSVRVLNDLTLAIPAGKSTALVGMSGSGKSSTVALLQRFYAPTGGRITCDGVDIQDLNLSWLRRQLAVVAQEPVLFSETIFENIALGLGQSSAVTGNSEKLQEMVTRAAQTANAHEFISALPDGYQTKIGERGHGLSSGQKQRIAIARALIRDPTVLIFDEATSALDTTSEKAVQAALQSASRGRTTISIAHRLSTIRDADNIVVMDAGNVVEQGTHDELMAKQDGVYAGLVQSQTISDKKKELLEEVKEEVASTSNADKENVPQDLKSGEQKIVVEESTSTETPIKKGSFLGNSAYVARLNRREGPFMIVGLIGCILAGCIVPASSVIFAKSVNTLSLSPASFLLHTINWWSAMYLILAAGGFIAWLTQGSSFAFASERLTRRSREQLFRSLLRQDLSFFDHTRHSTGSLSSLLSSEITSMTGLSGVVLGSIFTMLSTLIGGIILSTILAWKLALVCIATIPVILFCGWARVKTLGVFSAKMKEAHVSSTSCAAEAVSEARTIAAFGLEAHVLAKYNAILAGHIERSTRPILTASVYYSASQSFAFLCAALGFWYGGHLLGAYEYNLLQFFICFAALISGSQSAGYVFSYAPDISKARNACDTLRPLIGDGTHAPFDLRKNAKAGFNDRGGAIGFHGVSFHYPSRKERQVLDNLSFTIQPGQFAAIVGPSGCGKSTILNLVERFFAPNSGYITFDGVDIATLDVDEYRYSISLVGQDSVLYSTTIRDNLTMGLRTDVSDEQLMAACRDANISELIASLPDGLETAIGTRGQLLSGGQRQRLAIARALLRNPQILLLDEATSALDAQAEKVVQEALDKAVQGRTTIAVAHRLSTVRNADVIFVAGENGMEEIGTHDELVARKGAYFRMVQMQDLGDAGTV